MRERYRYSLALAYELISQFRQTSSKAGAVQVIVPPAVHNWTVNVNREYPRFCRKSTLHHK